MESEEEAQVPKEIEVSDKIDVGLMIILPSHDHNHHLLLLFGSNFKQKIMGIRND